MPENIPMPLRTREWFDRLSPEEQQLLLPQISLALGSLWDTLAQIAKQKDRAFADAFNNWPHYG